MTSSRFIQSRALPLTGSFVLGVSAGAFAVGAPDHAGTTQPYVPASSQASPSKGLVEAGDVRRAKIIDVVDGDTVTVRIDVWFGHEIVTKVRLRDVDAPELRSRCQAEAERAQAARAALEEAVSSGHVTLKDIGPDKYFGRVVARLANDDGDVGERLVAGGHARSALGGQRRPWC